MSTVPTTPDMSLAAEVSIDSVHRAAALLKGVARRTPTMTSRSVCERAGGADVYLKCENLQRVGAFKFRGAYNALANLDEKPRKRGVLTYSSGNHAQAIALASKLLETPATIVMPEDAPRVKLEATRAYLEGAKGEIVTYDRRGATREEIGARLASERGLTVVPPYDHPDVVSGKATAGLELFEDAGDLDALFVCLGGGGLLSGCATVARAMCPACRVIGVEPAAADDGARSFETRELHSVHNPDTIADGARTPSLGRYTFPIILERVDEIVTVSDPELARAMLFLWERTKQVIEPTGALAVAGLFQQADRWSGKRVGVVVSGGNVDLARVPDLLSVAGR